MKITVYELLGMVKDGKAPKKVKYKDKIYYYHEGYDFNYMYNSSDYSPMDEDKSLFTFTSYKPKDGVMCWDNNTAIDFLNYEVEILEEEKKIPEKLEDISEIKFVGCKVEINIIGNKTLFDTDTPIVTEHCIYKINQLIKNQKKIIDYLNGKGDE